MNLRMALNLPPVDRVRIEHGDCLAVLPELAAAGVLVDAVVTDPPYHLTSIVKRFGAPGAAPAQEGSDGRFARTSRGFMGQQWDGGDVAMRPETWAAVLAVMKPGAHLIAFGGTRTYHRLACAIEDAAFEIRDQIGWLYGSGFPKSHDVAKGIDKAAGAERRSLGPRTDGRYAYPQQDIRGGRLIGGTNAGYVQEITEPATDSARQWQGWGTALKPAWEPIVLARKPLVGTVAANVQQHGTGALNVDACRVGTDEILKAGAGKLWSHGREGAPPPVAGIDSDKGRWPANVIHDGSDEVLEAFPESDGVQGRVTGQEPSTPNRVILSGLAGRHEPREPRLDSGSAARFFYSAKADSADRLGSKHPTVKPVDLIAYLCRLITPPGGVVLDPFAGSGTTGMACLREGFRAILIERDEDYIADIRRRLAHVRGDDTPLFRRDD